MEHDYCYLCKQITKQFHYIGHTGDKFGQCLENGSRFGARHSPVEGEIFKIPEKPPIIIRSNYRQFEIFLVENKAMKHEYRYMDRMEYIITLAHLAKSKGWNELSYSSGKVRIGLFSITYWMDGKPFEPKEEVNWNSIALSHKFVKIMFKEDWEYHLKEMVLWDSPIYYYSICL